VVPALALHGSTLHHHASALPCSRHGGRAPELGDPSVLEWTGRFIGRIHAVGAARPFRHRPALDIATFGSEPCAFLQANGFIPPDLKAAYAAIAAAGAGRRAPLLRPRRRIAAAAPARRLPWRQRAVDRCRPALSSTSTTPHGPGHPGPVDDAVRRTREQVRQMGDILAGYEDFCDFNPRQMHLVEALRTLRLIHYSAWLARRWDDPAFPVAFPWFNTQRYWQDRILELREQVR
jgi:Ser/Thr protein kinase RdoA (MazF antagonist)